MERCQWTMAAHEIRLTLSQPFLWNIINKMKIGEDLIKYYQEKLDVPGVNLDAITANKIFETAVRDFMGKQITDIELSDLASDIYWGSKITKEIDIEFPVLAYVLHFVSELSFYKESDKQAYDRTIRTIHEYSEDKITPKIALERQRQGK